MKREHIIIYIIFFYLSVNISFSQKVEIYDNKLDGISQFEEAQKLAKEQNKHIFIQIGGNWCSWCYKFDKFYHSNTEIDSLMKANYVVIKVNYSPKNKNLPLMEKLQYPQRFGFPVLVITDEKGNRLHTQNTWFLEEGASYNPKKVKSFLQAWTPKAILPENNK